MGVFISWAKLPTNRSCRLEPDLAWSLLLNLADNAQKAMDRGGELRFESEMLSDGAPAATSSRVAATSSAFFSRLITGLLSVPQ